MREIKFRAWDKENKTMAPVTKMEWFRGGIDITIEASDDWVAEPYFELMQYTGLKDKNGKEIYEGDLIRSTDEEGTNYDDPVTWDTKVGAWDCGGLFLGEVIEMLDQSWEVIGNIYENPELVKAK